MNSELYYLTDGLYNQESMELRNLGMGSTDSNDLLQLHVKMRVFPIYVFIEVDENMLFRNFTKEVYDPQKLKLPHKCYLMFWKEHGEF